MHFGNVCMGNFENEFAKIYFDEKQDIFYLIYKRKIVEKEFIPINQKVLDIFLTLNTNKFYVDIRLMGVVGLEGQKWIVEKLFPKMLEHLGKHKLYHAQIQPQNEVFAKVVGTNIKKKAKDQLDERIIFETFFSEEEAIEWLKKF